MLILPVTCISLRSLLIRAGGCVTAIVGAGLGFLWFNTYPAQIFMGDVGSCS